MEPEGKTVATARIQRAHQGKRRRAGPPAGRLPDRDNPADGPAQVSDGVSSPRVQTWRPRFAQPVFCLLECAGVPGDQSRLPHDF